MPVRSHFRWTAPFITRAFANAGYARGEGVATTTFLAVETLHKLPDQVGFAVYPAAG